METAKRIMVLMIVTVLATGSVRSSAQSEAKISNARTANCLVKIICDPAILPLNLETFNYLLHSSGVGGKARREVLGLSPDQDYNLFTIEYVPSSASIDLGGVGLLPRDSRTGTSSISEEGMDEYEYAMMMEKEMQRSMPMMGQSTRSRTGTSSFRDRDRDRSRYRNSRTNRTSESTSSINSRGRLRDRGGGLYGYSTTSTAQRQRTGTVATDTIEEQAYLFSLSIHLPEDIKPLAREFMMALVDNLRESLDDAYNVYSNSLRAMLRDAESRRDNARSRLAEVMKQVKTIEPPPPIDQNPSDISVYERLEQIVDLPNLTQTISFADVIEQLKTAVDPPLQIQPNWKDLLENAEVEQTTPAGMDPLRGVKLRKALEILLASVSSDFAKLKYIVDEGVILIGTQDALPSKMVTRVYNIPALAYSPGAAKDLIDTIQNTIDPESWFEMCDTGEATITPYPRQRPTKLAILQTYENHQKIWKVLHNITIDLPIGTPSDIPEKVLLDDRSGLFREKQNLEMELARLQGRMPAIETQIRRIKDEIDEKIRGDQVSEELRKILDMQVKRLEGFKKLVDDGDINGGVADAEEKVARAKIELAKRREQIGISAGSDQLAKLNNELSTLAIDMAEKKAMLDVIKKQLDQTLQQLMAADISDPQVSRIRVEAQALEIAERRVNELNARYVGLQIPIVSVLGGD
jgi:hypothetical protein